VLALGLGLDATAYFALNRMLARPRRRGNEAAAEMTAAPSSPSVRSSTASPSSSCLESASRRARESVSRCSSRSSSNLPAAIGSSVEMRAAGTRPAVASTPSERVPYSPTSPNHRGQRSVRARAPAESSPTPSPRPPRPARTTTNSSAHPTPGPSTSPPAEGSSCRTTAERADDTRRRASRRTDVDVCWTNFVAPGT
jgi:hypothetical protein